MYNINRVQLEDSENMKRAWLKKMILPIISLVIFLGGTVFYFTVDTTFASILYFILILCSLGLLTLHLYLYKNE